VSKKRESQTRYVYSAYKSEVTGTSLFTGVYPKQSREAEGQIKRVRQADSQTAMVKLVDGLWI